MIIKSLLYCSVGYLNTAFFTSKCSPTKAAASQDRANRKVEVDLEVKMRREKPKQTVF